MGKVYRQKCWTCTHSCNMFECIWVETLNKEKAIKMQGCIFDSENFIISCNKYEKEQLQNQTKKLKALALGVSYKKYLKLQKEIDKFNLNITPEQLYKMEIELKAEKQAKEKAKEKEKQDFEKWREDKELQKEIDKATAKEYKITYKHLLEIKELAKKRNLTIEQYIEQMKSGKVKTPNAENAEKLKISVTYYCHLKRLLQGTNKSVEEYLQEREQQKQEKKKLVLQELEKKREERYKNSAFEQAVECGVSLVYYYKLKNEIKKQGLNISVVEYLTLKRERAKVQRRNNLQQARKRKNGEPTQQEKAEKIGITRQQYKDIVKYIKLKGLNISPEEYYKKRQEKKKNKKLTK